MHIEQLTEKVFKNAEEIAALWESTKSAHKRIDKNENAIEVMRELSANVEALAVQVKMLADNMSAALERIEAGQKAQGERIGALEKEPGNKWKDLVKQVITLVVAAAVGAVTSKLF